MSTIATRQSLQDIQLPALEGIYKRIGFSVDEVFNGLWENGWIILKEEAESGCESESKSIIKQVEYNLLHTFENLKEAARSSIKSGKQTTARDYFRMKVEAMIMDCVEELDGGVFKTI
ncbi:MAG: hypothetical protein J0H29_13325 [Sphingobacteriales bacterium]|nr:hypothetical protein [Sphingobacteriales bacterium]OJY86359.1 MAG: hypothetical protein BGP14_20505 [Sphingobacteriales bacterium 44-15]